MGFLQYSNGALNPLCVGLVPTNEAVRVSTNVLGFLMPLALLTWIWLGNGATYLARFGAALSARERSYSSGRVRLTVTSVIVAMFVGLMVIDGRPAGLVKACQVLQNTPSEWKQWKAWDALQAREL